MPTLCTMAESRLVRANGSKAMVCRRPSTVMTLKYMASCTSAAVDALSSKISDCTCDTADWVRTNRLMLNPDKSEATWCVTSRRQHQLPTAVISLASTSLRRGPSVIPAFVSMQICRCECTSKNERCRDVLLLFARSTKPYQQPRSRCL